jgi:CopG-like RHH_1 or ribbon-helix-helix domain, RHH_5
VADLNRILCIRLPEWVLTLLRLKARQESRTTSQMARVLLEEALAARKEGQAR